MDEKGLPCITLQCRRHNVDDITDRLQSLM